MKYSYLLSQILRSTWAMLPREALAHHVIISRMLNRDWDGWDQTIDLNKARNPLPVLIYDHKKGVMTEAAAGDGEGSVFDSAPEGSTAIIPLKGTMIKYGTISSYGTEEIAAVMRDAVSHKNIDSIVLDIDSGGGAVDAIAPMLAVVNDARKSGKPVVSNGDLVASAAYYVASATDAIVASNDISSEFGSIGVMMHFADVRPMWEEKGVKFHTIYAPESDYKNRPFELALEGKYEEIKKEELSPLAQKFQSDVKKGRGDKLDTGVEGILNGKMFFSNDAVKNGLIDEVGSMERSVELAKEIKLKIEIGQFEF